MHIIISGGSGLIGQALIKHLKNRGHQIVVIGRNLTKLKNLFGNQITAISWETFAANPKTWLTQIDWVINLAGANIAKKRWTAKRQQEIINSRVETSGLLARECASLGDPNLTFFNASAIGIYGLQNQQKNNLPSALTENTPIHFKQAPDFLAKVARAWEVATWPAKEAGIRTVNLRFGVVLTKQGGALPKIALLIKLGLGGKLGDGQQPFSWISLVDAVRAIEFIYETKSLQGPINCVAPGVITQEKLAKTLAKILKRPALFQTPALLLCSIYGQMAEELLLRGQNVFPQKLIDAGFKFNYPDIQSALKEIYGGKSDKT